MKTGNSLRKLETPPPEMAGRIMAEVRAWHQPAWAPVGWVISAQTLMLAALVFVSAETLPQRWEDTVAAVEDVSAALVQATVDFSDKVGGILLPEVEGGIL
ncbi:MAG: hypothetical protein FJ388_12365 [Verrucomicrobia bacterium]|nr:hypothetical protein [Verrucomicrobiota bacterium]